MTTCDCCTATVPVVASAHLALCDGCVRDLYGDPATYGQHDQSAIPERHRYNLGRAQVRWEGAYRRPLLGRTVCRTSGEHVACRTFTVDALVTTLDADTLTRATHVRVDRRLK